MAKAMRILAVAVGPKMDQVIRANGRLKGVRPYVRGLIAGECFVRFLATVPTLTEVRVLHKQGYPPSDRALKLVKEAARKAGVKVTPVDVQSHQNLRSKLAAMPRRDVKKPPSVGILVLPVDVCLGAAPMIVQIAQGRKKLPTFFPITDFVHRRHPSALGGYGVSQHMCGEIAARYVDKILWGKTRAGTLAVIEAGEDAFEWVVSADAARALNIKLARMV
jgi:ABC-type uncharacterized transport system substrate-binding protein